jgi:hypothetical protein
MKSIGLVLILAGLSIFIILFGTDIGNSEDTFAMALGLAFIGVILFVLGLILLAVGFFTKKKGLKEEKDITE